jgi:hypothetical protein
MGLYWDTQLVEYSREKSRHILEPISGVLKVRVNKSNIPDKNIPKYALQFEFDNISLKLDKLQFHKLSDFWDFMKTFSAEKVPFFIARV